MVKFDGTVWMKS